MYNYYKRYIYIYIYKYFSTLSVKLAGSQLRRRRLSSQHFTFVLCFYSQCRILNGQCNSSYNLLITISDPVAQPGVGLRGCNPPLLSEMFF